MNVDSDLGYRFFVLPQDFGVDIPHKLYRSILSDYSARMRSFVFATKRMTISRK